MERQRWVPSAVKDRRREYLEAKEIRRRARQQRIPFISDGFLPDFYLTQGLTLIGAKTGNSKSTTAANVIAGYLDRAPAGKQVVVISNEEQPDAIFERVACVQLQIDYQAYFRGALESSATEMVEDRVSELFEQIEIVAEGAQYDMSYVEDVLEVLAGAAEAGNVGMVVVDYLQTITQSRDAPSAKPFEISKRLGLALKDYGRKVAIPVVVFAQLNEANEYSQDMATRVQNDKHILNHAFIGIEIKPNFELRQTDFVVHKDRFWHKTGRKVTATFEGGRHVFAKDVL